ALQQAAAQAGVRCLTRTGVRAVAAREGGFDLELVGGASAACDRLLLATGGGRAGSGWDLARSLGHTLAPPVPSLFTFHLDDARLQGLAGVSVPSAGLHVPGTALRERGPVLVTHAGLSGPVVLKLSAWGARELAAVD